MEVLISNRLVTSPCAIVVDYFANMKPLGEREYLSRWLVFITHLCYSYATNEEPNAR